MSRLPAKMEQRQRLAQLLREEIVSHTELAPRFRERMLRVEVGYNLATWAEAQSGQPVGLPLLTRSRWQQFLNRFNEAAASSWKNARDLVLAERQAITAAASSPWERLESVENRDTHWCILAELASLADKARNATEEAVDQNSVADLVSLYTSSWWSNDWIHLRIRASCSKVHGLEQVRRVTDLAYFEYAVRVNERFASLIESDPTWPPAGMTGIESLRQELWKTNANRQAVIISDACRWDFAETVKERLTAGHCTLTPVFATLPTETEFGMTAMLPLGSEPVSVEFDSSRPIIKQNDSQNLGTRDGRREYLKKVLSGSSRKSAVEFLEMESLLKGTRIPTAPLVVVFDNNIDEQGHKGAEELPALIGQFVGNLKRTTELLHAAGIGDVHVVTDHGFLLLSPEDVNGQGTPKVLPGQSYHKDYRWAALKPDAPVTDVIRLPLPLAPDEILLGFCRGVRTLIKAPPYLHGGLSLQECVLPHLVSRHGMPQVRIGLDLQVSTTRLTGGTVPVILRPAVGGPQPPLGGIQPIVVRLEVESPSSTGKEALQVTEPIEVQVRPDAEDLRPAVYLKEGLGLKAGQELILKATDTETGQDLGSLKLTLLVDWD